MTAAAAGTAAAGVADPDGCVDAAGFVVLARAVEDLDSGVSEILITDLRDRAIGCWTVESGGFLVAKWVG